MCLPLVILTVQPPYQRLALNTAATHKNTTVRRLSVLVFAAPKTYTITKTVIEHVLI